MSRPAISCSRVRHATASRYCSRKRESPSASLKPRPRSSSVNQCGRGYDPVIVVGRTRSRVAFSMRRLSDIDTPMSNSATVRPRSHASRFQPEASMIRTLLAIVVASLLATPSEAAPSGQPIRIGSTLALTGPLAPTALLHKIAGEIYVEELNKANGLLGRPVEWVLLDDQSKPDLTRSLYEKLITVDKVDLIIGPYATSGILAGMGVAQRYQKLYVHHSFGMPHLAKYEMHFPTAAFGPEPQRTIPTTVFDALAATAKPPKTVAIVTSKFPSAQYQSSGAKEVAEKRGLKVVLYL